MTSFDRARRHRAIQETSAMTINRYTHDLYGREVDGWYWVLLEDGFKDCAVRYRASGNERAASIADRLAETADDVPAQLMQEYWNVWGDAVPEDWDGFDAVEPGRELTAQQIVDCISSANLSKASAAILESPAGFVFDEMIDAIASGYSPESATAFVMEFVRRMTGARAQ
jgi:hypothetical protein